MAFCTNCGKYAEDSAKFCGFCGAKIAVNTMPHIPNDSQTHQQAEDLRRVTVYDGEIHKCPNCGATLASFAKSCPDCGYELRGSVSTHSVQEFSRSYANAKSNSQKIDLIRTFVIPNTKEDILEFVILASSNIDVVSYSRNNAVVTSGVSQQDLIEAWVAKFEQAHEKANILLTDDPNLARINKLYSDKIAALEKARSKSERKNRFHNIFGNKRIGGFLPLLIIAILSFSALGVLVIGGERKLQEQVKQVELYISEGNYDSALTTAYSMSDHFSRSWTETRANLINRILELQGERFEGLVRTPTQNLIYKQVSDVMAIFTSAGFTNVIKEPVRSDFLTGLVDKITETKGAVAEISINGLTDYNRGSWVAPDSPVIIRYY